MLSDAEDFFMAINVKNWLWLGRPADQLGNHLKHLKSFTES
jgi:hypothetical protein